MDPGFAFRSLRTLALAGGLMAAGAFGAGCAATASGGPDLVYVSSGVQVIADYDEPIFYSDGYYWRNAGGVWYRSSYYTGGWAYARPPGVILSIHSPHAYRHYRPHGWAPRGRSAPVVRGAPPSQRGTFAPTVRGAPPPMHAGPTARGAPAQSNPGFHRPPPSGPRGHGPMRGHGQGHGHGPHR